MTIENENMIKLVNKEVDGGTMVNAIQRVYDLMLEIEASQDAIKGAIDHGYDVYKTKIDEYAKKGDYSKFVKKLVSELQEGKVADEVKVLENILDYVDIAKKDIK